MSLDTGRGRLFTGWKVLRQKWEETKMHWNDSVRQEFQEKPFADLEYHVLSEMSAIDRLAQVMIQVKQQCGDSAE